MAKGRRLKKVGSDLEAQKQSVPSSELRIWEQNVVPLESRINELMNQTMDLAWSWQMMKSFPR